ncbi:Sensor histidine kinase liaS [Fibrella aestuarina BUZ 2]|uniref:Sensor histidine kinase liaS n=1 Tax=Fibrella aestuarina BUZ 2 TaxID=1166018 RepID=I0KBF6_9BACT|nr:histidine kinase [Fibrella aestuarina]CCH01459.1 Sensor histidine kinase liaS [Fibrella aestuarina BUZ 2]
MTACLVTYPQLRLFLDGMLAMMAVYALLSFAQHRKAIYWQYAFYIGCMVCTFRLVDHGYQNPHYQPGQRFDIVLSESLALMLYVRFTMQLMDVKRNDPTSYRVLQGILGLLVGYLLLDGILLLSDVSIPVRSALYTAGRILMALAALYVVPRIVWLRQSIVTYFVVGSFFFVMGCLVALSINFLPAIFVRNPTNPFSFPVIYMQIGVALEVLCFTLGISMRNSQLEQEQLVMQAKLIEQLRENERKQLQLQRIRADIARDLHDDVGGDLSSISMLSMAADRELVTRPEEARALLRLIGESARQVLANMRQIVWSLRAPVDEAAGTALPPEPLDCRLREAAEALFEHQFTKLHLDLPDFDAANPLPDELCRELYLIHKELLHNVLRHAKASNVDVCLQLTNQQLCLRVTDDGIGFDPANVPAQSNGLASLHQRASDLGGTLTIHSKPGRGTTCTFAMPYLGASYSPAAQPTEVAI